MAIKKANAKQPTQAAKTQAPRAGRFGVERLADALRKVIIHQAPACGKQFLSIHEICAEYGVSPVTSQRSLKALEREGLLYSIKGSGYYIKELPAKTGTGHAPGNRRIGLSFLLPGGGGPEVDVAYRIFGERTAEELRTLGWQIRHISQSDLQNQAIAEAELAELDALVMSIGCYDEKAALSLRHWGRPVVVIQQDEIQDFGYHQVVPDLWPGCELAARELVRPQTQQVLLVNNGCDAHAYRNRVFRKVLAEQHPQVEVVTLDIGLVACDLGRLSGQQLGKLILERNLPRTIFSPSDFLAFGMVDRFTEAGLRLGRDVRLVSFDNLEGGGLLPFGEAVLTSIQNPRERVAREGARLMLRVLETREDLVQIVRVPTTLVRRKSSGS